MCPQQRGADFLLLLMTSRITSGLLFPLPARWPSLHSVPLSPVSPVSMPSRDPSQDGAEGARFHHCISTKWQHNGAREWCKPLFSCSRLGLWNGGEFFSHGFDMMGGGWGGGRYKQAFRSLSHCKACCWAAGEGSMWKNFGGVVNTNEEVRGNKRNPPAL